MVSVIHIPNTSICFIRIIKVCFLPYPTQFFNDFFIVSYNNPNDTSIYLFRVIHLLYTLF